MAMTVLIPWQPSWSADFEALAARIRDAVGSEAIRVDHIGSTSVPGMAAKDCTDVQVIVRELPNERLVAGLLAARFTEAPGQHNLRDHVPEGWSGDPSAWDKRVFRPPADNRTGNIHVRVAGRPNERYALLFRDFLTADRAAAASWSLFKSRLALAATDRATYGQVKDPATDVLMAAAEGWARQTGWVTPA